jgi:hypothetical protein
VKLKDEWLNELMDWLQVVWKRRLGVLLRIWGMIVLDAFKSHLILELTFLVQAMSTSLCCCTWWDALTTTGSRCVQWSCILHGSYVLKMTHKSKIVYSQNCPWKSLKLPIKYMLLYILCNMYVIIIIIIVSCVEAKGFHEAFSATSVRCQPLHLPPRPSFSLCLFQYM